MTLNEKSIMLLDAMYGTIKSWGMVKPITIRNL